MVALSWTTLPETPSHSSTDSNTRAPVPGERRNHYSRILWEVPKPGEDVGESVDVDHEENEDVGKGSHKKKAERMWSTGLEVDQGKMSITGEGCDPWER